ncbi:MAG: VIT1/CCC1 transporter family protein [Candidatus Obscuribacterales bacterium]|nr:VIT1/CCC1 transporter family protein [Candidatus Obscuribacterales bacterium]
MPQTAHTERHFTAGESIRDIVIGMSDGLTVPFALAAGLSGASTSTAIVVTAGLAEVAAGAIAMGLGGYLASRSDYDHYKSEKAREWREVRDIPEAEKHEVRLVFSEYGLSEEEIEPILHAFQKHPKQWVDFMMRFELGLEKPEPGRALRSAVTIGAAYIVGGLIPLLPYIVLKESTNALVYSVLFTLSGLFAFGFFKGRFTGSKPLRSACQTTLIGALAAAAAFGIASIFHQS